MLKASMLGALLAFAGSAMAVDTGGLHDALSDLPDVTGTAIDLDSTTSFESLGVVDLDDLSGPPPETGDLGDPLDGLGSDALGGIELETLSIDSGDAAGLVPEL